MSEQQQIDPQEAEAVEVDAVEPEAIETAEPEPQETPEPAYSDEDAEEARFFGWKAPEEWQGEKPAGYIDDPKRFLERVQSSRVFKGMQERLERQERQQEDARARLERMNQHALERQKQQYETQLSTLRQNRDRAAEEGDMAAYRDFAKQEQDLLGKAPAAEEPKPTEPEIPREVIEYRQSEAGQWLNNPVLARTAAQLIDANPQVMQQTVPEQIAFAEAEMRKMYPAYFPSKEPTRTAPRQVVDGGGLAGGAGARAASAFSKLPGEAKATFERFVKEGIYKDTKEDREDYANEYNR